MSSRRKRAPPVRVDEDAKKTLNWNMLNDRKNEVIQETDDQTATCSLLTVHPSSSSSFIPTAEDPTEAAGTRSVTFTEELPATSSESPAASSSLALAVVPSSKLSHIWKALIGEFSLRPAWLPADCEQKALTLHRICDQLCLDYSSCDESSGVQRKPDEDTCTVDCDLTQIPLEDLDWLQKRRVVLLCHQAEEDSIKVLLSF